MINNEIIDVAVCGCGPSGLMAAIAASQSGKKVVAFERMQSCGKKLLSTGGGRCNITKKVQMSKLLNAYHGSENFVKPALKLLSPDLLMAFFVENGLPLKVESNNQVYPQSNKSIDVLNCLLDTSKKNGVEIITDSYLVTLTKDDDLFQLTFKNGLTVRSKKVIIAAGGKTWPELGSDGNGYKVAEQFSHSIITPVEGLCGLVTLEAWPHECTGLSIDNAEVYIEAAKRLHQQRGAVLFTHKGISGPAILDISRYVTRILVDKKSVSIRIRPLPDQRRDQIEQLFITSQQKHGNKRLRLILAELFPSRLVNQLFELCNVDKEIRCADVTKADKLRLLDVLDNGFKATITDVERPQHAMVTSGGVVCDEINCKTMESLKIKDLYFCGEILDIDGLCGGYNLQWAFSSGFLAGKSAAVVV